MCSQCFMCWSFEEISIYCSISVISKFAHLWLSFPVVMSRVLSNGEVIPLIQATGEVFGLADQHGVCIYNTIMINYHYAAIPYYSMI